jgi:ribose 5-phosphate isomerase A
MLWKNRPNGLTWSGAIKNEDAKREVAARLAAKLEDGQTIGVGSGSTSFLTLQALATRAEKEGLHFTGIPTSVEVALACSSLGIRTASLVEARPDWSFDGADEVDGAKRLIKGRGGALYQEKLMMEAAPQSYIVVDRSKLVDRLGQNFPAPVEIDPAALSLMYDKLEDLPDHHRARQPDPRPALRRHPAGHPRPAQGHGRRRRDRALLQLRLRAAGRRVGRG